MQSNLQVFENQEFGKLEVMMIDDKPYFPAYTSAKILGYSKPENAIQRHCRCTLKRGIPHPQSPDKTIEVNFISEGDLYRLIIRSKLPSAERFERFVFDEVLPSIRRHGAYFTDELLRRIKDDEAYIGKLVNNLITEKEKKETLLTEVCALAPKARYCESILQCKNAVQVSIVAKDYGMTAVAFNKLLHGLRIQYKIGKTWILYSRHANKGYTVTNTYEINGKIASIHTLWTQRGRLWLYEFLKWYDILPQSERMNEN